MVRPQYIALVFLLGCHSSSAEVDAGPTPQFKLYPDAPRGDVTDTLFGTAVHDPYRWLENTDDPAVRGWSAAEDKLARTTLAHLPGRSRFLDSLRALRAVDEGSAPIARGGRLFYARRSAQDELPTIYVEGTGIGAARKLVDPSTWSTDTSVSFGDWWVSPDGTKIAYQQRTHGRDAATLRVADVLSGNVNASDDIGTAEDPRVTWLPDSSGFFYTSISTDPAHHVTRWGEAEIRQHRLGHAAVEDTLVFGARPDQTDVSSGLSEDGRWLLATVSFGWGRSRVYIADRRATPVAFHELGIGGDAKTTAEPYGDRLFVYTEDKAPNGKLYSALPAHASEHNFVPVVAERPDQPLLGYSLLGGKLALSYLIDGATKVEIHELDGRLRGTLESPDLSTVFRPVARPDDSVGYYTVQSFTSPPAIYKYDVTKGVSTPWFSPKVPFDVDGLTTERVFYESKGGVRIPMFVIHRKGANPNVNDRLILEGYGGFRVANRPYYRPDIVAWVQSGGVYAVACIRGGGEYGEAWHQAGMLHNKQNVFDDFVAAANYLFEHRYTSSRRLILRGASNGGLLVAAVMTQQPDLATVAVIGEPLTDMVRYAKFGAGGISEYGDPAVESDFRALFAYSPYHHIVRGDNYPFTLVTAAEGDERAHPMHARKLVAALQEVSPHTTILRIDFRGGHAEPSTVTGWAEKVADELAFAMFFSR